MESLASAFRPQPQRWALLLFTFIFGAVLVRTAWIGDDAAITFRSVENLVNGHGPVWNVGERVQSFTHPLWMLILSGTRLLTGELFISTLALSILIGTAGYHLLVQRIARSSAEALFAAMVLLFSRAFVDYSTSGLESVLSHFLLLLFLLRHMRAEEGDSLFPCALLAGLLVTNRMDTLLLVAPALGLRFLRKPSRQGFAQLLLGFSPFFAWEAFSLIYYGALVPNTALAKLNLGLPHTELFWQGLRYALDCLRSDPITLVVALFGLCAPFMGEDRRRWWPIALGSLLYLLYVLRIGGDFMAGRMFTLPLLVGVVLIVRCLRFEGFSRGGLAGGAILFLAWIAPVLPPQTGEGYGLTTTLDVAHTHGIVDERAQYYPSTGLLSRAREVGIPQHRWVIQGLEARDAKAQVVTRMTVGFFGYFAGDQVHILDELALCDPLLARIPRMPPGYEWRIGHYKRSIPPGYLESLTSGTNQIEDQDLARYYDKLQLLTRADLFQAERWKEIWNFLTGANEHLLQNYLKTFN